MMNKNFIMLMWIYMYAIGDLWVFNQIKQRESKKIRLKNTTLKEQYKCDL